MKGSTCDIFLPLFFFIGAKGRDGKHKNAFGIRSLCKDGNVRVFILTIVDLSRLPEGINDTFWQIAMGNRSNR